ncbi:MAG: ATP-binding cassette domain-containing protein [Tissierellia bacterium]|jgi:cell division transport system ATP-binding protein|nr:ATP-binding cassette domain-containing protein [Tissierellia bacterium]
MIIANNLSLQYPEGTMGLRDVNLAIPSGQVVFITGPSGSGKTSFIKLLIGIEKPSTGTLNVLGENMGNIDKKDLQVLRQKIGPIFQDFRLLDGRTVYENVILGMRFLDFSKKFIKEMALETIERVGLKHKINSLVDNLSYGERQRVAIARAVARKPLLIIADEPTGNLDKDNSLNILELLTSFRNSDTSVIITTHATHLINDYDTSMKIHVQNGRFDLEEASYERAY